MSQPSGTSAPDIETDVYADSVAAAQVRRAVEEGKPVRLTMLDLDSTLTGDRDAADRVRAILTERGDIVIFNTSRTEEMVMSRATYEASRAGGRFHRPPPHLGRAGDRRIDVPQEEAEPPGLLDPHIIAGSTGTRILVRADDGSYRPDESYGGGETFEPREWRERVFALIAAMNADRPLVEPAAIEYVENYEAGISDVYPPDYRMQLQFGQPEDRQEAESRLHALRRVPDAPLAGIARRVRILDDSEPRRQRYKCFVVPRWASKARAARHIVARIGAETGMTADRLEVLFVGDSYPDLHMALVGGVGLNATLLLVGGSRLASPLEEGSTFAGLSMRGVSRRLHATDRPGYLRYRAPWRANGSLTVIVGDRAFPGTSEVETVQRYLEVNSG